MLAALKKRTSRRSGRTDSKGSDTSQESTEILRDIDLPEWARRFGITVEELRHSIDKVGRSPVQLARHLRRSA
jgi:hypothetical protein